MTHLINGHSHPASTIREEALKTYYAAMAKNDNGPVEATSAAKSRVLIETHYTKLRRLRDKRERRK